MRGATHLVADALTRSGDPIYVLSAEAVRRARSGEDILNATFGALNEDDGRLALIPTVFEVMAGVPPEQAAGYAPLAGVPDFLSAVIRDVFGGSSMGAHAVAVATPGGTGALHHAIANFLDVGQALLTTSYHWGPYRTIATHARRLVETFPMFDGSGCFDVEALSAALRAQMSRQGRALLVLNTPCHNPTGYSLDDKEWEAAVGVMKNVAASGPLAVVLDLAYARFGQGDPMEWVRHVEPLAGDALLLVAWTASKTFTMYGSRTGALVAVHPDPAERERIQRALSFSCRATWSSCNHLGMRTVTRLLDEPGLRARADAERERLRHLLGGRVAAFVGEASRAGVAHPRYDGGFFVTVFSHDGEATARRMRELGVYVVPLKGGVRVGLCGTPGSTIPRLVSALAEGVRAASA